ncbi:MAG: hypothetical protein WBA41_07745 [Rivularia sp. (in: cyanobacteria)]
MKGGKNVEVSMEDLENYLYDNHDRIETRRKKLRRLPLDVAKAPIRVNILPYNSLNNLKL